MIGLQREINHNGTILKARVFFALKNGIFCSITRLIINKCAENTPVEKKTCILQVQKMNMITIYSHLSLFIIFFISTRCLFMYRPQNGCHKQDRGSFLKVLLSRTPRAQQFKTFVKKTDWKNGNRGEDGNFADSQERGSKGA